MSKLTEVEAALLRVDPTAFQQFGDEFLYFSEPGFPDIQRSGTDKGKLKPAKGHPDSYYRTADGKYVFIEHTTSQKDKGGRALLSKIKEDLLDCWSVEQTGVPRDQIDRIIYCCNSNLLPELELELEDFVRTEGIPLAIHDIKSLDTLSREVVNQFPWLAKRLGLTIDTGQLLPIRTFVAEYQRSPFATPLTLPLAGRESELATLLEAIPDSAITIVTGVPGTGKTRLVLAAMDQVEKGGSVVFCVSDKRRSIFDDLRTYLTDTGAYVLFLDDGNYRLSFLEEILMLLREDHTHPLHIVITARNSALTAVQQQCRDYTTSIITIERLDDAAIRSIVQGPPFHLSHRLAIDQILSIANGNPRLAVMAAQVTVDEDSITQLLDVSGLYHQYFDRIIDASVLDNTKQLIVMGLLAFFRSIDLADTTFCTRLFQLFDLDSTAVLAICQQSFRLELLDANDSLTSFRFAEQILGAYFFYRACIEQPLIDMGLLFREYFSSHTDRFKDMILAAYNTFGQGTVMERLRPAMSTYWNSIKRDEPLAITYLQAFWYGQTETLLHFVEQKILQLPLPENPTFNYSVEITPNLSGFGDPWLGLLANGYAYVLPELAEFFALSLDYIRRVPVEYPRLLANLKKAAALQPNDELSGFQRQQILLTVITEQGAPDDMPLSTLLKLAPTMLRTKAQFSSMGRTRDTMTIHRIQFALSHELGGLRDKIWQAISALPATYNNSIREFFEAYPSAVQEVDAVIIAHDNPHLLRLFDKILSPDRFADCWMVQQWIKTVTKFEISDPAIDGARKRFSNPTYLLYQQLRTDELNGVEWFELPHDIAVINQLKEQEIRAACTFASLDKFEAFFRQYLLMRKWEEKQQRHFITPALDIGLEEAMKNGTWGLAAVQFIIDSGNPTGDVPYRPFQWVAKRASAETFDALYQLVRNASFPRQPQWMESLIGAVPGESLTTGHIEDLATVYSEPGWKGFTAPLDWKRFAVVNPAGPVLLLTAIETSNRVQNNQIRLLPESIATLADDWVGDWSVLKATYLQQAGLASHFDFNFALLTKLVSHQPGFLTEYLEASTDGRIGNRDQSGLGIVWTLPEAGQAVQQAFNHGLAEPRNFRTKQFYPNLFTRIPKQQEERAYSFLCSITKDNSADIPTINLVLDCIRQGLPDRLEPFLHYLLSIQPDPVFFASLHWTTDSYVLKGNVIVAEVKAGEYRTLLDMLDRAPGKRHRYTEHRQYLQREIDECQRRAAFERKSRFLYDDD
jgi:hypothetical protein